MQKNLKNHFSVSVQSWVKHCALGLICVSTDLYAYDCLPPIAPSLHWTADLSQNSGFAIPATDQSQPIKITDQQQQNVSYQTRPLLAGYQWVQPNSLLKAQQHYQIETVPEVIAPAHHDPQLIQPEARHYEVMINPITFYTDEAPQIKLNFKSSEFAPEGGFGYGAAHHLWFDLTAHQNLKDYLIYVDLYNQTTQQRMSSILDEIEYPSAQHAKLHFINDICQGNLEFLPNQNFTLKIKLISTSGQIFDVMEKPLIFNTSGDAQLSFWQKLKRWWYQLQNTWLS